MKLIENGSVIKGLSITPISRSNPGQNSFSESPTPIKSDQLQQ